MKSITTLALILLTALPASARLGETKEQCEKRYGKPTKVTDDFITYQKATMEIWVTFFEGKACTVTYNKMRPQPSASLIPITEAERNVLLEANRGTSEWIKEPDNGMEHRWQRADKEATAQLSSSPLTRFTFQTPDSGKKIRKEKAEEEAREAKKLEGF